MSRLLTWLQSVGSAWLGPRASPNALRELSRERVRTNPGGYFGRHFLPYLDETTGETEVMRAAYRKMLREPYVKAALLDKVLTVAALDPSVNAGGKADKDRQAADLCGHGFGKRGCGLRNVVESVILPGLIDGIGVAEKVWELEVAGPFAGKVVLKPLRGRDIDLFRPEVDEFDNITGLQGMANNAGETFDPATFVIWTHLPLYSNPAGMSDLRAAYRAYWLMDTSWRLRAIFLEKFSTPMLKGTYNDSDQRSRLEEALQAARGSTWISIPQGALVEAMDLAMKGTADYQSAIEDLRAEMLIGIAGATLQAMEGTTAAGRGNSSIHKSVANVRAWYLSACVCDVVDGLFCEMTELNYAGAVPPKLSLGGVDDAEMAASLAVDQGLIGMGLALSKADLYKRYGRPMPSGDDALDPLVYEQIMASRGNRSGLALQGSPEAAPPSAPPPTPPPPAPQPGTANAEPGVSAARTFRGRPGQGHRPGGTGGGGRTATA